MSAFGNSLPTTLREQMNDDGEICRFQSWFQEHPAQTINVKPARTPLYDKPKSRFVDSLESPDLREAIRRYQTAQADEGTDSFWSSSDLQRCSWDQVFTELENAKKSYWDSARGNPLRRLLRKGDGIDRNLRPFLEGIPQDDGLGLIKGAFIIIFKAVQARSNARDKILHSFTTMPVSILDAERLRQCYPGDEPLFSAVQGLHDELVKCIPRLIDILLRQNDSRTKRLTKSIFGDPVADIERLLKPVEVAETTLERRRRDLNTKSIANTEIGVSVIHEDIGHGVSSMKQEISSLSVNITTLGDSAARSLTSLHEKTENCMAKQDAMLTFQQEFYQEFKKSDADARSPSFAQIMTPLYIIIEDLRRTANSYPGLFTFTYSSLLADTYIVTQTQKSITAQNSIRRNIMEVICSAEERVSHANEIVYILQRHYDFGEKALAQAQYLLQTPEFRRWFMSPYSEVLLVDGHCDDESIGRLAPTSLTCAGIARAMLGQDPNTGAVSLPEAPRLTLYFFIGEHMDYNNGYYGPNGLIRSFIAQILRQWPVEESMDLKIPGNNPSTWTSDTNSLCYLFEQLVCQLGPNFPVWCIVDGLSRFETNLYGWLDDLIEIISSLLFCKDQKSAFAGQGTIKVLLVSSDRSIRIRDMVDDQDRVELRAGNMYPGLIDYSEAMGDVYGYS
ncbi:hypothetical protein NW768_004920 [Fusarium equiseti]|uniref:Uncharacterized protein n=1 Tax=Fusarium equiseti TaxID=61235 RepID=A0ABQ8RHH6_FUSEQ|nr:hypothetical protein NW768_004920 [Fusarium equiseti]